MLRRDIVKTAAGAVALAATPVRVLADAAAGWSLPAKREVRVTENTFIVMDDGVKLAAQLWLPADADRRPAPVVVEYIPYRKRDRYRAYGGYWGQTLAQYGIGYVRLETRGSGDSTGLLEDEYLPRHHQDAAAAIAWLAAQAWCNGSVGMRGVSWGGFSTLQTAALAPPALKAIMPMCASDMRYTDDAHYVGGAFALTGLKWATSMKVVLAGPPDPHLTGEGWRDEWRKRLDATPAIAARWLSHQTNDDYWRQGSVALDWAAIHCPVYVVGGLVDAYGNEIPRLLANLKVPRKGLYGPWQHGYPSPATPGPALDWAWEEVRWWRHWLLGEDTGIMSDPMFRVYMPDATAAEVSPKPIPGRWVAEPHWPSSRVVSRTFHPGAGGLHPEPQAAETVHLDGGKVVGLGKVEWVPFAPTELPREQGPDDARSATFETPMLTEPLEILGAPVLRARVSSDRPVAHLAIRLCEVNAVGQSWLVTYGILNLTHREGHQHPTPLETGRAYDVTIPLNFTAHRFPAGSRIRIALSESLWPLVWPSPEVATLSVDLVGTSLDLPVRAPPPTEAPMPIALAPGLPADAKGWPTMLINESSESIRVDEVWPVSNSTIAEIGETVSGGGPNVILTMTPRDPASCIWRADQSSGYRWEGLDVAVRAEVTVTASRADFHVEERTVATLNGATVADVKHTTTIPRALG